MTDEHNGPDPWKVARDKIEDALRELAAAAVDEEGPTFLTDWYIVAAGHIEAPDGSLSVYRRLCPTEQAPHATLGLIRYELGRLEAHLHADVREE